MNLPYLTGRCSLQPGPLIALTAIGVGLCAGEGSVEGSCSLTSPPIARDRKAHHYPVLCATCYLLRKPLLGEGKTPLSEEKLLSQIDGCCSHDMQKAQRSKGVSGLLWCVWDVISRLCWSQSSAVHRAACTGLHLRAAACSKEPTASLGLGMMVLVEEVLQIWGCEWSEMLMEKATAGNAREMPAVLLETEVSLLLESGRELCYGQENGGREKLSGRKGCRLFTVTFLLCGVHLSWPHTETCSCLSELVITAGAREYLPIVPGTIVEGNSEGLK